MREARYAMFNVECLMRWPTKSLSLADEADFIAQRSQLTLPTKTTSLGDEVNSIFGGMFIRFSDSCCAWCNDRLLRSRSGRVRGDV